MIGRINGYNAYTPYSMNPISGISGYGNSTNAISGISGKESSNAECETCNSRKYKDGSNENVSFKSAQHISPEAAAGRVRAHEQEHVSNAYSKASKNNGRVISANVAMKTAICPECGRSYVAGGTTTTQIKYYNEENPYQKNLKATDSAKYKGRMIDIAC